MDKKQSNKYIKGASAKNIRISLENPLDIEKESQIPKLSMKFSSFSQVANIDSSNKQKSQQITLSLKILTKKYDYYEKAKFSNKQIGALRSYSFNTFPGLFKETNEDKIIAISQVKKPASSKMKNWPKISYFGIFDGHGGEGCADFLKDNFLNYLLENKNFPFDIKLSLTETFEKIEEAFFKQKCSGTLEESDRSGSCALVTLIFDNKIYIANIGDSRAIMSVNGGIKVKALTNDHKPNIC